MQSEEFDKKVIEAADHHHPAYDEQAWTRMEKLLDEHLPQKKDDRRRIIFFLLAFLLLGGGTWLFISKPWMENRTIVQTKQTVQQPGKIAPGQSITTGEQENTNKVATAENSKEINNPVPDGSSPIHYNNAPWSPAGKLVEERRVTVTNGAVKKISVTPPVLTINDKNKTDVDITNDRQDNKTVIPVKTDNSDSVADANATNNTIPAGNNINAQVNKQENKENPVIAQNSPVKKTKPGSKKSNSFFFTLSAGPDISFLGFNNLGKTKLLAGAGLGYTFKDRVTLRTGFYTGRKVYTASPGEYHPPAEFWTYYPYLESVDANCKVYEIPVSLSYNFGHSSKQHWFASAGVSSYLMKKETYNYFYKYTPTGPTLTKQRTLLDKNKHYFSVLTLSGGYERNISKNISLMVEPYVKLPMSGVGYGKVKLNSGGLLFSIGIKPFNAAKAQRKLSKDK